MSIKECKGNWVVMSNEDAFNYAWFNDDKLETFLTERCTS